MTNDTAHDDAPATAEVAAPEGRHREDTIPAEAKAFAAGTPLDQAFRRNARPSYPVIDRSRAGISAPPDYHPDVVKGDDPASASARSALSGLHETWDEVGLAARDQSVPSAELGRVATAAVERALRRADRASEAIARSVADAEKAVESKIAPAIDATLAGELRSWARSLLGKSAKGGQLSTVLDAVQADPRASAALLSAPPYLSGMSADQAATIRSTAIAAHAAAEGARLVAARRAAELVQRASARLTEEMTPRLRAWAGVQTSPLARLAKAGGGE